MECVHDLLTLHSSQYPSFFPLGFNWHRERGPRINLHVLTFHYSLIASCAAFYTNPWVPVVTAGPRLHLQRICAGPLFPALFLEVFCWTRESRSPILRSYTAFPLTFQQHSQISSRILESHFVDAIRFHASLVCFRRLSPILTSSIHASYFL